MPRQIAFKPVSRQLTIDNICSFRTADGQTGIIMEYCALGSLWDQTMLTYMREFAIWRYTFELVCARCWFVCCRCLIALHATGVWGGVLARAGLGASQSPCIEGVDHHELAGQDMRSQLGDGGGVARVLSQQSGGHPVLCTGAALVAGMFGSSLYGCLLIAMLQDEEVVARKEHDIWALGVIVFVMATRHLPWQRADRSDSRYRAFCCRNYSNKPWTTFSQAALRVCCVSIVV